MARFSQHLAKNTTAEVHMFFPRLAPLEEAHSPHRDIEEA